VDIISLQRTIAKGTVEAGLVKTKARLRAALREAIATFKSRMLAWVEANSVRGRAPVGKIPIATGYLKESATDVIGQSFAKGFAFAAYFGFAAEHAKYVDEGRPLGKMPPVDEIEAWCISVGIPTEAAWAIAVNIYNEGIEAKKFFNPGVDYAKIVLREELERAFTKYEVIAIVRLT